MAVAVVFPPLTCAAPYTILHPTCATLFAVAPAPPPLRQLPLGNTDYLFVTISLISISQLVRHLTLVLHPSHVCNRLVRCISLMSTSPFEQHRTLVSIPRVRQSRLLHQLHLNGTHNAIPALTHRTRATVSFVASAQSCLDGGVDQHGAGWHAGEAQRTLQHDGKSRSLPGPTCLRHRLRLVHFSFSLRLSGLSRRVLRVRNCHGYAHCGWLEDSHPRQFDCP